jgi:hypothetical protein
MASTKLKVVMYMVNRLHQVRGACFILYRDSLRRQMRLGYVESTNPVGWL